MYVQKHAYINKHTQTLKPIKIYKFVEFLDFFVCAPSLLGTYYLQPSRRAC